MTRAVFLDRDGVLNEVTVRDGKPYSPDSLADLVIVPDAAEALALLRRHGFRLVMVTNQPDIARGRISSEEVARMNHHVSSRLAIDAVEVCEHDDADNCGCRKPKPGMLIRAAARDGISLPESFMIGDRWRDIEAGHRAGCRSILIGDGYANEPKAAADIAVANLTEAAEWILAKSAGPARQDCKPDRTS
jgi:D-glycero-D-manno-heptose 1,7-bisphosphate phosphatase